MKLTTSTFIERAKGIHGNDYDYSKTRYGRNNRVKVVISCPTHGKFKQSPHEHLTGNGCPKCARDRLPQHFPKSIQRFVQESIKVHGNVYDYSLVVYINAHTKVKIRCGKHGEFMQAPHDHLKGKKCRECGYENRCVNNGFKWKSFTFPDGRTEQLQGYESLTVNYLISSSITPHEIRLKHSEKPTICYEWSGSNHRYHPDCYLNESHVIVETKSQYTWESQEAQNNAKIRGVIKAGYPMRVIIWNRHHELVSDKTYTA